MQLKEIEKLDYVDSVLGLANVSNKAHRTPDKAARHH